MIGDSSPLAAALGVVLVMGLSLLSVLCLRCKKKSKIIHEEHQIYNPQTFQRGGSVFAVTQSKTVTRPNQITCAAAEKTEELGDFSTAAEMDDQSDYQNISNAQTGSVEHTYVAPLADLVYENEPDATDADPGVYANIQVPSPPSSTNEEDDYENTEFLEQVVQEQDDYEPDYVNEHG
ncbi:LAT2 domain-containing protein isoform X1 [Pungitius pungitius]|uniref:LAT2 domain-containing protein isoform X1 n=1 Tax=Pungitius pungitius TaxID=134920 RepID=UPI002E10A0C0